MSSGFVSGGTTDAPIERSNEWLAAQQEIEANRRKKALEARQNDGKSLFEILEANKAAKQDAFEEANKIKNQFRALDEDEVDFLDSVLESTRAEEDRVKRETAEGLELFRKQQEEADKKAQSLENDDAQTQEGSTVLEEEWVAAGRKRKRTKDKEVLKGVKIRRGSSGAEPKSTSSQVTPAKPIGREEPRAGASKSKPSISSEHVTTRIIQRDTTHAPTEEKRAPPPAKSGLGLVDYGSDEDDD